MVRFRFFLQGDSEPSQSEQIIGISGLFFISIVTVIEANLAFKKASIKTKAWKEKIISSKKKDGLNNSKKLDLKKYLISSQFLNLNK